MVSITRFRSAHGTFQLDFQVQRLHAEEMQAPSQPGTMRLDCGLDELTILDNDAKVRDGQWERSHIGLAVANCLLCCSRLYADCRRS